MFDYVRIERQTHLVGIQREPQRQFLHATVFQKQVSQVLEIFLN